MASARPDTWMPLYIGDYLADTTHLTRELHGSYLLLLFALWRSGGKLPDDDRLLAAAAKATPREWRDDRKVLEPFFIVGNGMWRHKRVEEELGRALSFIDKQRKNGGRGGRPKKPRETQTQTQTKARNNPSLSKTPSNQNPPETTSPSHISSSENLTDPAREAQRAERTPRAQSDANAMIKRFAATKRMLNAV